MKKTFATSLGKAAAFSAIALAVNAAVAQEAERVRPLVADVKITKQLQITGQPPAGYNPQFTFNVHVTENELPKPPEGCHWEKPTYQPAGGNATAVTGNGVTGAPAQVTVINHLVCAPKCEGGPLDISLGGVSQWRKGSAAMVPVNPRHSAWAPNGAATWVNDVNSMNIANGSYVADIKFCMCPGSKASVQIANFKADDKAITTLTPGTFSLTAGGFGSSAPAATGTGGAVNTSGAPQNFSLNNTVTNIGGGPMGWMMTGNLRIENGYLGACRVPR